jgi:predicted dehydrogenase
MLHDLDLCLWMFGEVERVYAFSRARRPPLGDQHFLASLRHRSGVITHLEGSWAHVEGFRTRFEVSGSEGVIEFDSGRRAPLVLRRIQRGDRAGALVVPESPSLESPYQAEVRHFLDLLEGRGTPCIEPGEALLALEVALGAARSAEQGRPVKFPAPRTRKDPA